MAAELELKKINEYVQECLAITSITGSYVYGIDSNGNSIKIAVEVLASAGTDYSQQIAALTTKCNNNTTLITALQSAVNGKANSVHTHQISDVANLQTALDGKSNTGHTHQISDVAGLQTTLNGKSDTGHTHTIVNVSGLQSALDAKSNVGHTHGISDVANLQPTLANHEQRITDLEEQGGGTSNNSLKQVDLNTYDGGTDGEIVQHVGETTADYINGYTYKCEAGEAEKTIPSGSQCIRLTQNGEEYISDGEADTSTTRMVMVLQPTAEGVTYNVFAAPEIATADIENLVGCYVPDDRGVIHQIASITHSGSTLTSVTLDNGVTLEITSSTPVKSTLAWYEYFSKSGERYYGGSGSTGYMIAAKDFVSSPSGSQSYPIATAPIGTAFGGTVQNFTASEDIIIRAVSWTQSPTQPKTSVASGDNFLTITNDEIGASIDIAYNSQNQHLELKGKNSAVVSYVDMSQFIVDGMLDNVQLYTTAEQGVTVEVPYLKFTFNVASGKSVIRVSLKDLVDIYDGANINLTSAFVKAATYSAPAIGDSMNVAIGKLLKGHEDNAAAIATKQDELTFDSTPTANSTKPVTSQGIKAAIDSAIGNVPNALKQKDLSTYTGTDGEIVQHVGATSGNFVNGYVYKFANIVIPKHTPYLDARELTGYEDYVSPTIYVGTKVVNGWQEYEGTPATYGRAYTFAIADLYVGATVLFGNTAKGVGIVGSILSDKFIVAVGSDLLEVTIPSTPYNTYDIYYMHDIYDETDGWAYLNVNQILRLNNTSELWNAEYTTKNVSDLHPYSNSTDYPIASGWQRVNVQPSSEGAVSDLETRMTAAETAIGGKQASITGAASTITDSNLTSSRALASDANGKVAASTVTSTELATLRGVTSDIQTQLNAKAPSANTVNGAPLSNAASYFYGVSTSAAADTMKTVSIPSITTLNAGQVIVVMPTINSNTIANATLKVNNFASYPIKYKDTNFVNSYCWNNRTPCIFVFDGNYWIAISGDLVYQMSVEEGITGTAQANRYVRADYLQQIIHGQIDKFVGTRAMTEDAYWDLVTAGTVQADTLYITYDNDWED